MPLRGSLSIAQLSHTNTRNQNMPLLHYSLRCGTRRLGHNVQPVIYLISHKDCGRAHEVAQMAEFKPEPHNPLPQPAFPHRRKPHRYQQSIAPERDTDTCGDAISIPDSRHARNLPAAARLNKCLCEPQIRACMQMRIPCERIFDEQPVLTVFYPDPALKPDRKDRIIRNICYR